MHTTEYTGRIRIKSTPGGEAPLWVRARWIGLVLPCHPYLGLPDQGLDQGVLSGTEVECNYFGFSVPQDRAIQILAKTWPKAADWWKEQGFPKASQHFGFAQDEAECVSGIILQRIFQVTAEMGGNRNR